MKDKLEDIIQASDSTLEHRNHRIERFINTVSTERTIGSIPKKITEFYLRASDFLAHHHMKKAQRPLDYIYSGIGVGQFMRKEQITFCEILNIKPKWATTGNAIWGMPIGLSYYVGPNFFMNCVSYLTGSDPTFEFIDSPDTLGGYVSYGFAAINVTWDVFRITASQTTRRPYPGIGVGVMLVNLQSIYLNRSEIGPYFSQLGREWKQGALKIFNRA
jgi:hypothetical protein